MTVPDEDRVRMMPPLVHGGHHVALAVAVEGAWVDGTFYGLAQLRANAPEDANVVKAVLAAEKEMTELFLKRRQERMGGS